MRRYGNLSYTRVVKKVDKVKHIRHVFKAFSNPQCLRICAMHIQNKDLRFHEQILKRGGKKW